MARYVVGALLCALLASVFGCGGHARASHPALDSWCGTCNAAARDAAYESAARDRVAKWGECRLRSRVRHSSGRGATVVVRGCDRVARLDCRCERRDRGLCESASCSLDCEESLLVAPPGVPPETPEPLPGEMVRSAARRWNTIAHEHYDESEFKAAARAWVAVAGLFDETPATREERETATLVALAAYVRSLATQRDDPARRNAVFGEALAVAEAYEHAYREAYGPGATPGLAFVEAVEDLKVSGQRQVATLSCPPPSSRSSRP